MAGGQIRLQDATRELLRHANQYHGHEGRHYLATVIRGGGAHPVIAELHDSDVELEEDENLYLSQSVRQYDADYAIEAGDNLTVVMIGEGVWHATAVFSDSPVSPRSDGAVDGGDPFAEFDEEMDGAGP